MKQRCWSKKNGPSYALLDNYLNLCLRLKEYKRADDIEKIFAATRNEVQFLHSVAFHRLTHSLSGNAFQQAVDFIEKEKLEKRLRRYEKRIGESRAQAIRYTCGQAYFLLGNYDQASDWFFQIVNARVRANPTARLVSEILHHICHFELNSFPKDPFRPMKNLREKLERSEKNDQSTLPEDSGELRRRKKMADFCRVVFGAADIVRSEGATNWTKKPTASFPHCAKKWTEAKPSKRLMLLSLPG